MPDTTSTGVAHRVPKLALHLLTEDVRREALEFLERLHSGPGVDPTPVV